MMASTTEAGDTERKERGGVARKARWIVLGLGVVAVAYLAYLTLAYSVFYSRNIFYPQDVLALYGPPSEERATSGDLPVTDPERCEESRLVAMQIHLIDYLVEQNMWVPARPLYKVGFFGLVDFKHTPFFDNKASEQIGVLDVVRRAAIELTDSLGRVRGTSLENTELASAQAALRIDENAWFVNNPFSSEINTISPSAATSYAGAIPLYEQYNISLRHCDAVFDARADNLRETLSRFTATLGATTSELEARSKATIYDPEADRFVDGSGNNLGYFDMEADNYFFRARGKMFALHGLLQGMREDFHGVLEDRNVQAVWDKMEASVAEAAALDPLMVSNGGADDVFMPDHLAVMAEIILRSRTSMVEVRDILDN
jgi:hypothetical protein